MNKVLLRLCLVLMAGFLFVPPALAFDHSHSLFDQLLHKNVVVKGSKSAVKYGALKDDPARLNAYLDEVEKVSAAKFQSWNRNEQIAFLINAYNALTIKLILTKYPDLESIKDLGGFFSGPWKIEFFTLFGEKHHLDYIEHELLRKNYKEPRVHFALVCASISCPPLRAEAYLPQKLDQQLDEAMKAFLGDPDRNRYDADKKVLYLSPIFKWFAEDFIKSKGSVAAFVAPWVTNDEAARRLIVSGKIDIVYLDYNWSLNKAE